MRAKLFVGNLAYDTGIEKLEAVFRPFAGFLHVKICYDRHTGKPLGYAVVHFDNPAAAQYAIELLHNMEVDGRHIVVAPYRPRVGDPSAPKPPPKGGGQPAADEATALVMDLHKNATWMDLKDILSQHSKVLFVDEPRTVRAAVVHFASEQDRDQARAIFRNSHILGNAVDIVPVEKDSVILDPGYAAGGEYPSPMHAHTMQPPMMPLPYVPSGMPQMSPYARMDQSYTMQRPAMWQGSHLPSYAQPMQLPGGGLPGGMHSGMQGGTHGAVHASSTYQGMPAGQMMAAGIGATSRPEVQRLAQFSGPAAFQATSQQQQMPGAAGSARRSSSDSSKAQAQAAAAADAGANLSPEIQQLVRQLALSRIGHPQDSPQ